MHPAGHHVLLVDHDPARRAEVERLLIGEGFAVMPIGDGLAAIRAARQGRFALAVAALGLPGALDGPATVRQLRRHQPWLRALYTADTGERRYGPVRVTDDVIPWPCREGELVGCVFEMLQRNPLSATADDPPGHAAFRRR
jgi:DNA-binding response OmpR family regulator